MSSGENIARYQENLQAEIDGAFQYRVLAELERQSQLAELYERLAATEERHASFWEDKLRAADQPVPPRTPSRRARILAWSARRLGPGVLSSTLTTEEQTGQYMYDDQPETEGTSMRADERSHARMLRTITGGGGVEGGALARLEGRHRAIGGNALRAAVLGANDGLVSNLALVMGVAGADISHQAVLITGFAGLLAGASSMALGEWLSVQSSRELYQRQIDIEASEIAEFPEEEEEELALIYQAKGLPEAQARQLAARIMADHGTALDTLSREELGIDPEELGGSPWEAATASFFLFALGAIIPVLPFLFTSGAAAVITSLSLASLALFGTGAGITLVTGKGAWRSGLRQAVLGLAAAALTFGIGSLLGVAISG
ncbi:MAG: VIT1/CCC1 transporter family protein [Actinomycetota bacterium]